MPPLSYPGFAIVVLFALFGGTLAYRGIKRQAANLLSFLVSLGGLVGGVIGFFFDAFAWGAVLGMVAGALVTIPWKKFQLTGRPAVIVGYGWAVLTLGYIVLLLSLGT